MKHARKSDQFELRRSPSAEVSQSIAAVHHDRMRLVGVRCRISEYANKRNMNRAAYVAGVVLMTRQHVDDPRAQFDQLRDLAMIDAFHNSRCG